MITCSHCFRRLSDTVFRSKAVTRTKQEGDARYVTEGYRIKIGSICPRCEAARQRFRRGTQTTHDCAMAVLYEILTDDDKARKERRKKYIARQKLWKTEA